MTQGSLVQKESASAQKSSSAAKAGASRKVQMVAGASSFAEGEARLAPPGNVQMEKPPEGADSGAGSVGEAGKGAEVASGDGKKPDAYADERAKLEAAGREALAKLPATSAADASKTPGAVGQGEVDKSGGLPDWFMEIQGRLVASTTWGEAEENAQHAIRDYAMLFAKEHAGPDGKVPGHIQAFFEYIGRGSKNDAAAKKGGYKGSSELGGAAGAKNWCAGAATSASRIAKKEGRAGVIAYLASLGLAPKADNTTFFSNLAQLSGASKAKSFYGSTAYAEPLLPGDRVDYLFDTCQYGGHAVHVVADLGDSFLHVSGNTTKHSAVATGAATRVKSKPEGLDLTKATTTTTQEDRNNANNHLNTIKFGGSLVYMIQRDSDPYKALEMLNTEDSAAQEAALKKLFLKRTTAVQQPAAAPGAQSGGAAAPAQ